MYKRLQYALVHSLPEVPVSPTASSIRPRWRERETERERERELIPIPEIFIYLGVGASFTSRTPALVMGGNPIGRHVPCFVSIRDTEVFLSRLRGGVVIEWRCHERSLSCSAPPHGLLLLDMGMHGYPLRLGGEEFEGGEGTSSAEVTLGCWLVSLDIGTHACAGHGRLNKEIRPTGGIRTES